MSDEDIGYFNKGHDPYCYQDTDILVNNLGIMDAQILENVEKQVFLLNYTNFNNHNIEYTFDLGMLKKIHWVFFKELYPWAGEIRTVELSRGIMFCRSELIESYSKGIFEELKKERYLEGLDVEKLADRLAYYLGEINAIHPFREGNGRTQRKFIELLAAHNGYTLVFDGITKEEMYMACEEAMRSDHTQLTKLFAKNLMIRNDWLETKPR